MKYTNKVVTTINPAVTPDGSNVDDTPHPVTQPHICSKSYLKLTTTMKIYPMPHNDTFFKLNMEGMSIWLSKAIAASLLLSQKESQLC